MIAYVTRPTRGSMIIVVPPRYLNFTASPLGSQDDRLLAVRIDLAVLVTKELPPPLGQDHQELDARRAIRLDPVGRPDRVNLDRPRLPASLLRWRIKYS